MIDRDECRMPTCSEPARDRTGYSGRFCSDSCEDSYEHLQADARDAAYADQEEGR
jgi:hypothetical protein